MSFKAGIKLSELRIKYLMQHHNHWIGRKVLCIIHARESSWEGLMKTGFSLWSFPHREKPVFITGIPAMRTGLPVMKTGFSLIEKLHRENPVFITGIGLQNWHEKNYILEYHLTFLCEASHWQLIQKKPCMKVQLTRKIRLCSVELLGKLENRTTVHCATLN